MCYALCAGCWLTTYGMLLPCCLLLIIMLSFFNWRAIIVTDFDKTAMKLLEVGSPLQTLTT
jgi:hypothetical protein